MCISGHPFMFVRQFAKRHLNPSIFTLHTNGLYTFFLGLGLNLGSIVSSLGGYFEKFLLPFLGHLFD